MMTELRDTNRAMFWRIIRRLLSANRGRLFVMLLALGAGAAVTAALLNLQVDAKRRLTNEFKAFGANVLLTPEALARTKVLRPPRELLATMQLSNGEQNRIEAAVSLLYLTAEVGTWDASTGNWSGTPAPTVVVGFAGDPLSSVSPFRIVAQGSVKLENWESSCIVGERLSERFQLSPGSPLRIDKDDRKIACRVSTVASFGAAEDNQVFVDLWEAHYLTGPQAEKAELGLIATRVSGQRIEQLVPLLKSKLPEFDVRPVRQFTEAQARIYSRISGVLNYTVGIVLLLTALCVMAAMTNVAIERKMDVGLMKAIGGATRRVVRLFLAEAALLGLASGLIGAALGILLSIGLGKAVFGVAARPRLIVYPVAVGLTMLVAILSAFPLRRLASIRPASVFRGEA